MVNVKPEQFQKIWSALITPTNEDESVNYEALERIVELQIQDGAEGFYCCGSSGEGCCSPWRSASRCWSTCSRRRTAGAPLSPM